MYGEYEREGSQGLLAMRQIRAQNNGLREDPYYQLMPARRYHPK